MQGITKGFCEKLVGRVWRAADYIRAGLIVVATLIIASASVLAAGLLSQYGLSMLVPIIVVGSFVGAWYLLGSLRIEYEYSYFNGELDLDVITAKSRRRRVATVNVRDFTEFGSYAQLGKSKQQLKNDYDKRWFMCSSPESPDCFYAVFNHEHQKVLLVFEPGEEILAEIRSAAPRLFR